MKNESMEQILGKQLIQLNKKIVISYLQYHTKYTNALKRT
jgi:hypothetical protein